MMKIAFANRINVSTDTLNAALLRKVDNHSFSEKTFTKLVSIANRDNQLSSAVAESIFKGRAAADGVQVDAVSVKAVKVALSDALKHVKNEHAKAQFSTWLASCDSLLSIGRDKEKKGAEFNTGPDRLALLRQHHGEPIYLASGSYGCVLKMGDHVIKQFNKADPAAVLHELNICNDYMAVAKNQHDLAYLSQGELVMPFVEGGAPTQDEVKAGVKTLYEQGFIMGDPKPGNFKVTNEGVVPIDFGQVVKIEDPHSIHKSVKFAFVHDYMRGGYRSVPDELKGEYLNIFKTMSDSLGSESPFRFANIKQRRAMGYQLPNRNPVPQ